MNQIWNGPTDAQGNRVWYGLDRGASLSGLAGTTPFSIATDHFRYWIHQDPSFDWHTVTYASFVTDMLTSIAKFNDVIGTDDDLNAFHAAGGKMITYHGLADPADLFPGDLSLLQHRSTRQLRRPRRRSTASSRILAMATAAEAPLP